MNAPESATVRTMRRALIVIMLFGLIGTEIELFLLKHTEGFWQQLPIWLIGVAVVVVLWAGVSGSRPAVRSLQGIAALFLVAGAIGVIQHYNGNLLNEQESNPGLSGLELYRLTVMGATPLLAPGIMLQLGLTGLLYAFRHPALAGGRELNPQSDR